MSSINTIPVNLSNYLSNTKTNSKKLVSDIEALYKETDGDKVTVDTAEKFVEYYNKIIKDNSSYDDDGLKALTTKMKSIAKGKSSALSSLGITIASSGKLILDKATLKTAVSEGDFSEFVSSNEDSGGLFDYMQQIANKLKKDNTYYLSSTAKKIVKNAVDTYA